MEKTVCKTIDEYLLNCTPEYREKLEEIISFIKKLVPDCTEKISWGLPTYSKHGSFIQLAECKGYIGFYPGPEAVTAFSAELEGYKTTKAAVHLPMKNPLPYPLMEEIIKFNVASNEAAKKRHRLA